MQRMGVLWAVVPGLLVVVAAVWAQMSLTSGAPEPEDGLFVAVVVRQATPDARVLILDEGGRTVATLRPENGGIPAAPAWSPDGSRLAWVEFQREGFEATGVVWERGSGRLHEFGVRSDGFRQFAWSPDSELLASPGPGLQVWDRDGRVVFVAPAAARSGVNGVPLLPWTEDSRMLISMAEGALFLYDRAANSLFLLTAEDFGLDEPFAEATYPTVLGRERVILAGPQRLVTLDLGSRTARVSPPGSVSSIAAYGPAPEPDIPSNASVWHAGATSDGGGRLTAWTEGTEPAAAAWVSVSHEEGQFDLSLPAGVDLPLRNVDVVLAGDWPEP